MEVGSFRFTPQENVAAQGCPLASIFAAYGLAEFFIDFVNKSGKCVNPKHDPTKIPIPQNHPSESVESRRQQRDETTASGIFPPGCFADDSHLLSDYQNMICFLEYIMDMGPQVGAILNLLKTQVLLGSR